MSDPKSYCFVMEAENENGAKEEYFMLAHELPEDQSLREKLQKEKLVSDNLNILYVWIVTFIFFNHRI